jgi:hypothetical protein
MATLSAEGEVTTSISRRTGLNVPPGSGADGCGPPPRQPGTAPVRNIFRTAAAGPSRTPLSTLYWVVPSAEAAGRACQPWTLKSAVRLAGVPICTW